MRASRWRTWLPRTLLALLVAAAFLAYLRPAFVVDLANRWIFCW